MKTIDIKSGDSIAQFTTKSVTIGGKEYFYSQMSDIAHNSQHHIYRFTCGGDVVVLPYEEKDSKVMSAIFAQVYSMHTTQKAPKEASETKAQSSASDDKSEDKPAVDNKALSDKSKLEKSAEKEKKVTEKAAKKAAKKAEKQKNAAEKTAMSPEKRESLKKSLIIFGLIVIIIAAIAVIYGAIFGTNSAPTELNPNSNESQQYDEIDQLINELQ